MEQNKEMISIIVPVYNVEDYLCECVNSILEQSYTELEIILVDDGSTDLCPAMCDEYAKMDRRVKTIHKQNGGLADARNAGLRIATGEYIGYVDSDDYIHPRMYEWLYESIQESHAEIAICRFQPFSERAEEYHGKMPNQKCFTRDEILDAYINENTEQLITPSVWSKLFKRECIEGLSFPVGKLCEDIVYTTKAFYNANKVSYLEAELYYYRQRVGSIMNNSSVLARRIKEELEQYNIRLSFIQKNNNAELIQACKYALYNRTFLRYCDIVSNDTSEIIKLESQLKKQMCELRKEAKKYYCKVKKQYTIIQRCKIRSSFLLPVLYRFVRQKRSGMR